MKRYPVPGEQARAEIRVVNSRFIATIAPVFTVAEARAFIDQIRAEFGDATHNVPAYLVGYPPAVTAHSSDDGEPSGTAGRPALAVLRGSGLGDAAVVVTRYYGGTKLGTGGLVRAYSDAVRAVLDVVPRAERVPTHTALVVTPYNLLEQVRRLVAAHRGELLEQEYTTSVTLTVRFPVTDFEGFQMAVRELSRGQIEAEIIETSDDTIMPLLPEDSGPDVVQ